MVDFAMAAGALPTQELLAAHPTVAEFFRQVGIEDFASHANLDEILNSRSDSHFENYGLDRTAAREMFGARFLYLWMP